MIMNSKFRYMYDAAPQASFRARAQAPITVTTDSNVIVLDQLDGYWTKPFAELADMGFAVVANVLATDHVTGDEGYKLDLVTNNGVVIATTKVVNPGQYILFVDVGTAKRADPGLTSMKLTATLSGTTPILDYFAWLGKHLDD